MDEPIHVAITRLSASSLRGGGLAALHQLLQARASTLARTPNELKGTISSLSFEECSLGVCHLLALLWDSKGEANDTFAFDATVNFLERCRQSQIQQCAAEFITVVKSAVRFAIHADEQSFAATTSQSSGLSGCESSYSLRLLEPLLESTEKFRPGQQDITSADTAFLQLCLRGRFYDRARRVLDRDAFKVTKLFCQGLDDCAAYFFAAGEIWIALEEYEKAFDALDMALSLPSIPGETDSLQVEAFKRFALVSLMLRGRVIRPPPPSPSAEEALRMATYHKDFAQHELLYPQKALPRGAPASSSHSDATGQNSLFSFLSTRLQRLEQEVRAHESQLKEDNTFHLALALLSSVVRRKVKELSRVFLSLPLESFRTKMNVASDQEAVDLLHSLPSKPGSSPLCTYDEERRQVLFRPRPSAAAPSNPAGDAASEEEGSAVAFLGALKREVEDALHRVKAVSHHMRVAEAKVTDSEGFARFVEVADAEASSDSQRDRREGRRRAGGRGRASEGEDSSDDDGQSSDVCWQAIDGHPLEEDMERGLSSRRGDGAGG
uniref:COP9 signalosome complex subunit 3 n=1 Tax=Neospora caninum (strain Liverpool) TaxID=572307 RepID=A0A0F7UKE9_NEOCL|nr:TPA: COP9 signalosome complex subunit 3 [Neospora caninum Liverpool]